jgi:hypothetical protein
MQPKETKVVKVQWSPCCFCGNDIESSEIDPCWVQVTTAKQQSEVWFCHAACFKKQIVNPPYAPGMLDPAHF